MIRFIEKLIKKQKRTCDKKSQIHFFSLLLKLKWRREQDSNLQARKGGSFQDYCITNYAISPHSSALAREQKIYPKVHLITTQNKKSPVFF